MFNRAKFVDQSNQKTNQNNAIAKPMNMEKKAAINIIVGLGVARPGLGVGREETYYHGEMVVAFNKDQ